MHTLACLYTHAGKAARARELLLKAMDEKLEEPDSSVWLAYAQIAEAYGEPDAAQAIMPVLIKPSQKMRLQISLLPRSACWP